MMLYKIFLVLFIFGAAVAGLNESGIMSYQLPETDGATIDQVVISEYTNSTTTQSVGSFGIIGSMLSFLKIIGAGLASVAAIGVILAIYGCPVWIAGIVQAGVWIVTLFGIYELWSGNIGVEK